MSTQTSDIRRDIPDTVTHKELDGILALAAWFMNRKGYPNAQPMAVERLVDLPCWYLEYELETLDLELEIYYDPQHGWQTKVVMATPATRLTREEIDGVEQPLP